VALSLLLALLAAPLCAQSANALISGSVIDKSGAPVPNATVTLKSIVANREAKVTTGQEGLFTFPNLPVGDYEINVAATGFRTYVQKGIVLGLNDVVRIPVNLELGTTEQTIEVRADVSQVNFETPEVKGSITREEIQSLPLMVSGGQRSSASFVTLLPGVNGGETQKDAFTARFNGGQQYGDEAVLDGVTMQEGLLSQSGMVALQNDFPIAPEAVGEISVLTSNYDTRYGSTAAAVIVASTKEGTNDFHGTAYAFFRNEALNARQWGAANRSVNRERDIGFSIGGPMKVPIFTGGRRRSYFFVHHERYRSSGATTKPILTVPTDKMKQGDFTEWPNPIYDPLTSRTVNGVVVRDQFNCGGRLNVICGNHPWRATSLADTWLKLSPSPNRPGILNNYESPNGLASSLNANTNQWDVRGDMYWKDSDHFILTYHYRGTLPFTQNALPPALDGSQTRIPNYSHVARMNWDHIFTPTVLNHFAIGWLDLPTKLYTASDCCVDQLPQIKGAYNYAHAPAINFGDGINSWSGSGDFYSRRPTWAGNDSLSWITGRHTFTFGGEYRNVTYPNLSEANGSGTYNFYNGPTGILGQVSGNSFASFLLGAVSSSNVNYYSLPSYFPKAWAAGVFFSDTYKMTKAITLTYGVRWDRFNPSFEGEDRMSFFDPVGPNPSAGNRPGRMVFAGDNWGEASAGVRYPETAFNKAFAPRMGIAYAVDSKTVVRAGYGMFFMQNFYPGWDGGVSTQGFNLSANFNSSMGGLEPAFLLQNGIPQNFQKPPFTTADYLNGQNAPNYRPKDANELPYSQQWNLSIERQLTPNMFLAVAYVGNKGTRLVSQILPTNVLSPTNLSMGTKLLDEFKPGMTSLNGVPVPYAGWVNQLKGCAPSVAQAMLPFPQYCNDIRGQNENVGNSTYHSLQMKLERRMSNGIFLMASYTFSKNITDADSAQSGTNLWSSGGGISPFERQRNKGLSSIDNPHIFNLSATYELPFGKGKKFNTTSGFVDALIGGWNVTGIYRANGGVPLFFRSSYCNVPGQFAVACIPGVLAGKDPWAQDKSNYDPSKPLFNKEAFEDPNLFNYYYGSGSRITNLRGFSYRNLDIALLKNTKITERVLLQIRMEAFNAFNNHYFTGSGVANNDVASPAFGMWNGGVTQPRNVQLGAKVIF
jgi:hypothetical protein